MVIGDTQYSRNIFSFRWSNEEREAIGLYEVVFNNTNKKDEAYYTNTDVSYNFADGAVTASYGSATALALADRNATDDDGAELDPVVVIPGLKSRHKERIKNQAASELLPTDWYAVRKADAGTAVPSAVTTYRAAVRTRSGEMETLINNAANVDALAALYEYVNTGTEENPVMERPLGEWPVLEV
jgi:hypothetical protein